MMYQQVVKLDVRVASRKDEAEGIVSLELVPHGYAELPEFTPGSHVDVHLGNDITRQYSICNDPSERHRYVLGILREPASRGGSEFIHAHVREGDTLSIGVPRSNFPMVEKAVRSVLIAGGIGVTPLLAMAYRLSADGQSFALHYSCRSLSRVAFKELLESDHLSKCANVHLSDGDPSQRFDFAADIGPPEPGVHLYVCGPKGFIEHVLESSEHLGWPKDQVHVEFFVAQDKTDDGDLSVVVTAAKSNVTVEVPAGTSIAHALTEAGIDIPLSCEQGICGTCITSVLEGDPLHRDDYLSDLEKQSNKLMAVCCSWARSRTLVLDL